MMLVDAGPLVALLDKDDANFARCVDVAKQLPTGPLLTTWPCFTEAMYLLGEVGGFRFQFELWKLQKAQRLILHTLSNSEIERMAELMEKYHDTPMDLADASIVAAAENLSLHRLFALDSDFHFYRLKDGSALEIVP